MGKKYIIAIILIGIFLTACQGKSYISDGQSCPANYNDDTEKIFEMIGGKWIAQNGRQAIEIYKKQGIYYIKESQKIPDRHYSLGDFDIYEMSIEEDEFDSYEGQYIIELECNADEMQCKYTFSFDEEENELYYGDLEYKSEEESSIKTSNELVNKYFPGLDDWVMTFWEYESPGDDNSSAVGPCDYCYKGYIVLEDGKVSQLLNEYSWEKTDFSPSSEKIDMSGYEGDTWSFCEEFQAQVMKGTVAGKIYSNGEILWFEFTTM